MSADGRDGNAVAPRLLCWAARIAGVAAIGFISLFALDVLQPGAPLGPMLVAFAIQLMPSVFLAGVLIVAWFWPLTGGLAFLAVALLPFLLLSNAAMVNALLAAPFAIAGALFLACFVTAHRRHSA